MQQKEWFIEKSTLNPSYGTALTKEEILFKEKSAFQEIEVFRNQFFGKVLLLDGIVMFSERDERSYHEMIVHIPLQVGPAPKRVLVLGGGDGGVVRELLKYPSINEIHLVEIDQKVCEVAEQFFPEVSSGLRDPRVKITFQDGLTFVQKAPSAQFDVILSDSTDPAGVGARLHTESFFEECARILTKEGIMVNQSGAPLLFPEKIRHEQDILSRLFPLVMPYWYLMPTYPSCLWLFTFASKKWHPLNDVRTNTRGEQSVGKTQYYNQNYRRAYFQLPPYLKEQIKPE